MFLSPLYYRLGVSKIRPSFGLSLLCLFCLAGCSVSPTPPLSVSNQADWQSHIQKLEAHTNWQIRGKIAFKDPSQTASANMRWKENASNSQLRLFTSLGVTVADLSINGDKSTLEVDNQTYVDSNPQRLLAYRTGWDIPVTELRRWVKALPYPEDSVDRGEDGLITTIRPGCQTCSRWQIDYKNYKAFDGLLLPTQLTVTDTINTDIWIKVRISSWR